MSNNQKFEDIFKEYEEKGMVFEIKRGEIYEGEIINKSKDEIYVALPNSRYDAVVNQEHLIKPINEYKSGDKIRVKIMRINEREGLILASERNAQIQLLLDTIKEGAEVEGNIVQRTDKGYIVMIGGVLKAFLPGSHSMMKKNENYDPNKTYKFIILKSEKRGRKYNIVLSRKEYIERYIKNFFDNLKENSIVEGIVSGVQKVGVFVDLNEYITGLIPASEISWDKDYTPFDLFRVGDKVKALVIAKKPEEKKVTLSVKRLSPDPWENIEEKYPIDSIHEGTVVKIHPFGFIVKLEPGISGLVHKNEIFWTKVKSRDIREVVNEGDVVKVKILEIDKKNKKISLSYKQALGDPWEDIEEKYPEGSVQEGTVEKILPNGVIIALDNNITGFCHVSELSWNFIDVPDQMLKEGDKVKVRILSINKEERKIKLSVKRAIENPWKRVIEELKEGDTVKGEVIRYMGSGAVVLVDNYNVEAFIPISQVSEERIEKISDVLKIGDKIEGKILKIALEHEGKRGNMILSLIR